LFFAVGYENTDAASVKMLNILEADQFKKIVNMSEDWYKKGLINKDVATLQDGMPVKKAKKAFMWGEQLKPGKADEMKAQLGYDLIQVSAYSDKQYYVGTADLTNSMMVISRKSEDSARAMMFLNLLFSDKQLKNLLDWGIENKHYKKIGENQIDFADGVTAETSGYTGLAQWAMGGSQFLDYLWANEAPDKWQKMEEFNNSAKPMKTLGWTCNLDGVKTEVATITNVWKTYGEPIQEGIVSYDKQYPKMKKALETAGVQKVIDEAQKQVDTYLKGK
jgi:putative aldouronate transport system substrate-binding protein